MAQRSTHLPIVIDIPEPCPESWQNMVGGNRERHCARCEKRIHNLSALSEAEIAELVTQENVCISLEVMPDGELVTAEPRAHGSRGAIGKVVLAAALTALAACSNDPRGQVAGGLVASPPSSASAAPSVVAASSSTGSAAEAASAVPSATAVPSAAEHVAPPQRIGGTIPAQPRLMGKPMPPQRFGGAPAAKVSL